MTRPSDPPLLPPQPSWTGGLIPLLRAHPAPPPDAFTGSPEVPALEWWAGLNALLRPWRPAPCSRPDRSLELLWREEVQDVVRGRWPGVRWDAFLWDPADLDLLRRDLALWAWLGTPRDPLSDPAYPLPFSLFSPAAPHYLDPLGPLREEVHHLSDNRGLRSVLIWAPEAPPVAGASWYISSDEKKWLGSFKGVDSWSPRFMSDHVREASVAAQQRWVLFKGLTGRGALPRSLTFATEASDVCQPEFFRRAALEDFPRAGGGALSWMGSPSIDLYIVKQSRCPPPDLRRALGRWAEVLQSLQDWPANFSLDCYLGGRDAAARSTLWTVMQERAAQDAALGFVWYNDEHCRLFSR